MNMKKTIFSNFPLGKRIIYILMVLILVSGVSALLGGELVTDSGFDDATKWINQTFWVVNGYFASTAHFGCAVPTTCDNKWHNLSQDINHKIGETYNVTITATIDSFLFTDWKISLGGDTTPQQEGYLGNTFSFLLTPINDDNLTIQALAFNALFSNGMVFSDISVKRIIERPYRFGLIGYLPSYVCTQRPCRFGFSGYVNQNVCTERPCRFGFRGYVDEKTFT